jgi:FHA domain/Family of unknown function (DUF5684)
MSDSEVLIALFILSLAAAASLGFYFFVCFIAFRVGRKFKQKAGYGRYCIPGYNAVLLCRCAQISPWHLVAFLFPYLHFGASIWLWGNIARRLGKSFWAYGLGSLLFIPIVVLALGNGEPVESNSDARGSRDLEPVREPAPAFALPAAESFALQAVRGEIAGAVIGIPKGPRQSVIIGRDPHSAQLVVSHAHVSSRHARLHAAEPQMGGLSGIWLEDLDSKNGTFYRRGGQRDWIPLRGGSINLQDQSMIRIADAVEFMVVRNGHSQ